MSSNLSEKSLPEQIDIAIVGAGPHALTLATHLLQKRKQANFLAFDPSGTWMNRWNHQFAALEIPHLRSPAVHQPVPDPHALRTFAERRPNELVAPYALPGTQLFREFCQEVVQRWCLDDKVYPAAVVKIEPLGDRFRLRLADGQTIRARRVVLANGGGAVNQPSWVDQIAGDYPSDRLCHSHHVDLRGLQMHGERVLIVGGGLTSGHLAVGAIARGAQVILMTRRQVFEKLFDAEPGWVGPKYLKGFFAELNWQTRWQMIQDARNGGSFTPTILTQLRRLAKEDKIIFYEHCQVSAAQWEEEFWRVSCDRSDVHDCIHHQPIDRIWFATGSRLDAAQNPLLTDTLAAYPLPLVNGLPILDENLRWRGCDLFIMGGLAALCVGPTARNLSGARMASDRIVPALTKGSMQRFSQPVK